MTPVATSHIWLDHRGVAWIDDTNIKVIEVAEASLAGVTPEQIVENHPGCYSLAQVHAALAYYHDNKRDIDAEIARQTADYERLRRENLDSAIRQRLRSVGQLP